MPDMKKLLHTFDEADELLNGKIERTNLSTIVASATASVENKKTVLIKGTGRNIESLKVGGRTVQDGTPTPDAPVEVLGVGDEVNLFNIDDVIRDGTYYLNDDGIETNDGNSGHIKNFIKINPNHTCTITSTSTATFRVYFYDVNKQWLGRSSSSSSKYAFKRSDVYYIQIQYLIASSTVFLSGLEIYNGKYKIPVSCNGETTNIYLDSPVFEGETFDLVGGVKDKKWKVFMCGSNKNWHTGSVTTPGQQFYIQSNADGVPTDMLDYAKMFCTTFKNDSTFEPYTVNNHVDRGMNYLSLFVEPGTSLSSFKELIGEDFYIIYESTETTTETFDTSPIPTISGNNELSINTEVTPASIDITSFGDYYSKAEINKLIVDLKADIAAIAELL